MTRRRTPLQAEPIGPDGSWLGLDRSEMEPILRFGQILAFRESSWLFHTEGRTNDVYLVGEGEVELLQESPDGRYRRVDLVSEAGALGGLELLLGHPFYLGSARARSDGWALRVPKDVLLKELAEGRTWATKLFTHVTRDVGRRLKVLGALLSGPAPEPWTPNNRTRGWLRDPVTGLPTRALFSDRLSQAMRRAKRLPEPPYAVLLLDLDRFKFVNDSLGYPFGDRLLATVARRIEACVREVDCVARFGGDEFTVLLEDTKSKNDSIVVARRIHEEMASSLAVDRHHVFATASVGIAYGSPDYAKPEDILRDADIAMHRAKTLGGARCEVFEPRMREEVLTQFNLETDLREAVKQKAFSLHYQPIVSLETGTITGVEALIRWRHPEKGWIPPVAFIPLAEQTGLIMSIGEWVIREACRQMGDWRRQYHLDIPLRVSINLSAKELSDPSIADRLALALKESGLEPDALKVEITESMLMENGESARTTLSKIKELQVRLLIDDFGTGYSSLSCLQDLPFDTLKIDRSFVSRMRTWRDRPGILSAIVSLAHDMGLDVIAEGIETDEQVALVRSLGCECGQGYFFFKPMDPDAIGTLLARGGGLRSAPVASR